jgi:hypothetical protein
VLQQHFVIYGLSSVVVAGPGAVLVRSAPAGLGPCGGSAGGGGDQVCQETADLAECDRDEAAARDFGAIAAVTARYTWASMAKVMEPVPHLPEQRRGGEREPQVPGEERHHLGAGLQDRHVGVEIDPVQALDIQHHMPVQHAIHRYDPRHDDHLPQPLLIAMMRSPAPMHLPNR